jgi:hypothetical protein
VVADVVGARRAGRRCRLELDDDAVAPAVGLFLN